MHLAWLTKRRRVLLVPLLLLLALALLAAWYARPVDIYQLSPGLRPEQLGFTLQQFSEGINEEVRYLVATEDEPLFHEVMDRVEALRFRRSPFFFLPSSNLSKDLFPGAFYNHLQINQGDRSLFLGFWVDEWTYSETNSRPISLVGGEEASQEFNQFLWENATPDETMS